MRRAIVLLLVVVGAGTLGAVGAGVASTTSPSGHRSHVLEYVCHGKHYKPHRILIACGDGNAYVQHLDWTKWSRHKARAGGVWVQNNCKPDCADGHFVRYPVRMRLSQVIVRGNAKIFGRVVGIFPKHRPPYPAYKHHRILVMNHGKQAP